MHQISLDSIPTNQMSRERVFQEATGNVKSRFDGKCFAVLEKFLIHC
jgi:hypothetical protein